MLFPGGLIHVLLQPSYTTVGVIWHDEACRRLLFTTGLAGYVS